ncbi:MAG: hypothetical protein SXQ77_07125, partial [Halobacteria archaeon]|nr:hypothetical protein [Halobacteria archaeon]
FIVAVVVLGVASGGAMAAHNSSAANSSGSDANTTNLHILLGGNESVVERYDTNDEAGIQEEELADAFVDYMTSGGSGMAPTMEELKVLVRSYFAQLIEGLEIQADG